METKYKVWANIKVDPFMTDEVDSIDFKNKEVYLKGCFVFKFPEEAILMQFTGCSAKNGEIYEGDIVKTFPGKGDLYEVEFWKGSFILNTKTEGVDHRYYFVHYKKEELEIIGNVFQNKDLLEQKT